MFPQGLYKLNNAIKIVGMQSSVFRTDLSPTGYTFSWVKYVFFISVGKGWSKVAAKDFNDGPAPA